MESERILLAAADTEVLKNARFFYSDEAIALFTADDAGQAVKIIRSLTPPVSRVLLHSSLSPEAVSQILSACSGPGIPTIRVEQTATGELTEKGH